MPSKSWIHKSISFATLLLLFAAPPMHASVGIDVSVSGDGTAASTSVGTPLFSTSSTNELLLAFVSTDYISGSNTTVQGITGGALTWVLVKRSNVRSGTSEVWRAYAGNPLNRVGVTATLSQKVFASITVVAFTGIDTSGTNGSGAVGATGSSSASRGAPTASLVTTRNNAWVFGVGNDFDNPIARTVGAGQTLVHQYEPSVGDTYWVQMQNAPTPLSGTTVAINDTAPTGDRYNLAVVEVLPSSGGGGSTFSISGVINPSSSGSGATLTLSGAANATVNADASGNYVFSGLGNGSYTITPAKPGFTFSPSSQVVNVNGANLGNLNFTSTAQTWGLSGTISPSSAATGTTITLGGAVNASTTPDASGNYSFSGLANGVYTVTPSQIGFSFSPVSSSVNISGSSIVGVSFTASSTSQTWSVSGTITPSSAGSGATITLTGTANASTIADSAGNFTFTGLSNGAYTATPSKTGFIFSPTSLPANVNGANLLGINFTGAPQTWGISGTISPASAAMGATVTLSGAASGAVTPDVSGNYTFGGLANGSYTVTPTEGGYTFNPSSQTTAINGAAVSNLNFTAQTAGTTMLAVDATTSRALTAKATTVSTPAFSTNSGNELLLAFIAADHISGTNTTVSNLTGAGLTWSLVKRTNVQSGTAEIWRAFASTSLSGVTVTATLSQSVVSSITVMSFSGADATGSNGSGAIGATASASAGTGAPSASLITTRNNSLILGVGNDFDNAISRSAGSAQSLVYQVLTVTGDTYWVQRQNNATPLSGTTVAINDTAPTGDRYNLSIVELLPAGSGGVATPPSVSMTSPPQNATVSGQTTISATASDPFNSILGVQFLLDGKNLGAEVTSPPYSLTWDASSFSGIHTLEAIAYNSAGLNATSAAITVTVDNSGNGAVVGSWSPVVNLPTVAVNLILLKNNKLLFYEDGTSVTLWDYSNGTFSSLPTSINLFCSGHAVLADGRVLVVGGFGGTSNPIGIANAEIFDPENNTWTQVPSMAFRRWYPTATTLSDGRVLVTAGWQTSSHSNAGIPEIYNPSANSWTQLTGANNPFETYPFIYQLADGRVIHLGGSEYATDTEVLDLNTQTWSVLDPGIVDGGSSAMYQPGKIMKAGSAADSQNSGTSSRTTFILDTTQSSPAWVQTSSMVYPRSFFNLVTLPDDSVLAVGGETDKNGGTIANAVYAAELWSSQTHAWTTMASMHTPREYHSTALLLPDGRVVVSGMGADFGNVPDEKTAEFYSPPYLFKGPRPVIAQAPSQIQYGTNFFVATPDGATITSATLIRTGAVTHFFDQNTRFVPLTFQQTADGLTVSAPENGNLAPPGYYMLFILNGNGVPSVAPIVHVGP